HLPEARPRARIPVELEGPRHSEMEERPRPLVQLHPEVFALAPDRLHPAARERPREAARADAVVDDRVGPGGHLPDAAAAEGPLGPAARILDVGKLGHRWSLFP